MISWHRTTTSPPMFRYTPYLPPPPLSLHSTALQAFARRAQHDADLVDHPLAHALVERLDQRRAPQAELVGERRQIGHHDQGTPPDAGRAGVPGPRFPDDLRPRVEHPGLPRPPGADERSQRLPDRKSVV